MVVQWSIFTLATYRIKFFRPAAATKAVATTKTTVATETPIVKASRDDEARRPVMLKNMNRLPLAPGDEVAFVDFDCSTDYVVVQKVESFDQVPCHLLFAQHLVHEIIEMIVFSSERCSRSWGS